jgi:hypothetical protein
MTETTAHHRPVCTIDPHAQLWDLGGTIELDIEGAEGHEGPPWMVHEGDSLKVRVIVKLTGRILHYLCDTKLCVCLAFESCGPGPEDEYCAEIELEGKYDPCTTDTFVFEFDLPGDVLTSGKCGRKYDLCITLGSKDCCGHVGFIFGSCKDFSVTVLPALEH